MINCCASNEVLAPVAKLIHAGCMRNPSAFFRFRLLFRAIENTWTPIVFRSMLVGMLAPRCFAMANRDAFGMIFSFPFKHCCTLWGHFPLAFIACFSAWTSKLTFRIAPVTNVICNMPSRILIGGVITVLVCNITLKGCPRLLPSVWLMSDKLWCQWALLVSHCIREGLAILFTSVCTRCPGITKVPAPTLNYKSCAIRDGTINFQSRQPYITFEDALQQRSRWRTARSFCKTRAFLRARRTQDLLVVRAHE